MKKNVAAPLAACVLAASAPLAFAEDGTFSLGTGLTYTSGDYGTSTTTKILSVPFTARYDKDRWTLKATIPYLRISGGSAVIPGLGTVPNSNPRGRGRGNAGGGGTTTTTTTDSTASGWGDLVTSVTYNAYYDQASKLGLDLTGKVKWGTADRDKGLGTGENDYGAQADLFKTFDRTTVFGGIGYTKLGSSDFVQLNSHVWNATAGFTYKLNDRDSAGLAYDVREKASATSSELSEITAFWSRKLDRNWKLQAFALKGLANGSPDWGAGISAAYAF
ncbi:MAG TPA: hypothetical protein VHL85_09055 [Burkholderiales bacterium]|jgi:hypothetical protein|nr:hypothetical protein [Burkholderiales bacterium]